MPIIKLSSFSNIGMETLGYMHPKYGINAIEEIFVSHYGVCVMVCYEVWYKLLMSGKLLSRQTPKHLFWSLLYMKVYCTQRVLCTIVKTSRKTFNKHVHHVIKIISEIEQVSKFESVIYERMLLC